MTGNREYTCKYRFQTGQKSFSFYLGLFLFILFFLLIQNSPGPCQAAAKTKPLPADIEQHFRYGHEFYMMKKYTEAIVEFENVKLMAPQSILGYLWTGKANIKLKEYDLAIIEFNKALVIDPDNSNVNKLIDRYSPLASIDVEPIEQSDSESPFIADTDEIGETAKQGVEYEKKIVYSEDQEDQVPEEVILPGMDPDEDSPEINNLNKIAEYNSEYEDPEFEEICQKNIKNIKNALFSYNLDHLQEMTEKDFSIEKLLKGKYLTKKISCPSKGQYRMKAGAIYCTFHNAEMFDQTDNDNTNDNPEDEEEW